MYNVRRERCRVCIFSIDPVGLIGTHTHSMCKHLAADLLESVVWTIVFTLRVEDQIILNAINSSGDVSGIATCVSQTSIKSIDEYIQST